MYWSKLSDLFVQIGKCICPNCKIFLYKQTEALWLCASSSGKWGAGLAWICICLDFKNVFVQIGKWFCPNSKMYLFKRAEALGLCSPSSFKWGAWWGSMCIQIDCNMYLTKLQNVFPQVRKMHLSKLRKLFDFALLLLENEDWVEDGFEDDFGETSSTERELKNFCLPRQLWGRKKKCQKYHYYQKSSPSSCQLCGGQL